MSERELSFCTLVIQSTLPVDLVRTYDSAQCYVNWELDGRAASRGRDDRVYSRTRRIHITWDNKRFEDSYLVFVAPERYSRPNSDAHRVWGDEALFLGRTIDTEMGNQALIKSWLDLCRETHRGPCRDDAMVEGSPGFGDIISQSYFGVVDVLDMQLTSLPFETHTDYSDMVVRETSHCEDDYGRGPRIRGSKLYNNRIRHQPYIALSYVWGRGSLTRPTFPTSCCIGVMADWRRTLRTCLVYSMMLSILYGAWVYATSG